MTESLPAKGEKLTCMHNVCSKFMVKQFWMQVSFTDGEAVLKMKQEQQSFMTECGPVTFALQNDR